MQEKIRDEKCYQCFYYLIFKRAQKEFKGQGAEDTNSTAKETRRLFDYAPALKQCGDELSFLTIIKTYIDTTKILLTKIKTVDTKTIQEYTVIIQEIKKTSKDIGAEYISGCAEELECAAKAGRLGFVRAANIIFQELTARLLQELQDIFEKRTEVLQQN